MSWRCLSRQGRGASAAAALVLVLAMCLVHVAGAAEPSSGGPSYEAPSAEAVRAEVQSIFDSPRFAPQITFWQWLGQKLSGLDMPDWPGAPIISNILLWVLLAWCVLTLLAIVGHTVWSLRLFMPARGQRTPVPRYERLSVLTYEELRARMEALADEGDFRSAVRAMMAALVRWLDEAGIVRCHPSKTNGDYVREYPPERPAREMFRQFALTFDALIYGGTRCGSVDYRQMRDVLDRIRENVAGA